MKYVLHLAILVALSTYCAPSLAKSKPKAKAEQKSEAIEETATDKQKLDDDEDVTQLGTSFNFNERSLGGKMKGPPGMTLKGRVQQNKNQMVKLRTNFRSESRKSETAARVIKPTT